MRWSLKRDLEMAWWQADVGSVEQSGALSEQQNEVRMRLFTQRST